MFPRDQKAAPVPPFGKVASAACTEDSDGQEFTRLELSARGGSRWEWRMGVSTRFAITSIRLATRWKDVGNIYSSITYIFRA